MVNNQLIASSIPVVAEGNQERGLMVNLDANDGDSYLNVTNDENTDAWRDLTKHRYLPNITPSEHFKIVEWTGNGQSNRLIDVGFQPAFIMLKQNAGDPGTSTPIRFIDSLRGATTAVEAGGVSYVATDEILGFTDHGFTIGDSDAINKNNVNFRYTAWCWKGNPQTESLTGTSGDYTRTVNETGGFSAIHAPVVGGGAVETHGYRHGLSVSPTMFFAKESSIAFTYTQVAQDGVRARVDGYSSLTSNFSSAGTTGFNGGNLNTRTPGEVKVNNNFLNLIPGNLSIYNFAEVRGYSKMGVYFGTGTTEAYDVGFKPKLLMVKRVNGNHSIDELAWKIFDSTRGTNKEIDLSKVNDGENIVTSYPIFDNNGWSWAPVGSGNYNNLAGIEYVYMAFADDSIPLNEKLELEDDIIFRISPSNHDSVSPQPNDSAVLDVSRFDSHMVRHASVIKNTTTDFLRFTGNNTADLLGQIKADITGNKSFSFWFNIPANPIGATVPTLFAINNLYSPTINLVQFIVGGTTAGSSLHYGLSQNHSTGMANAYGYSEDDDSTRFDGAGWQQLVFTEDGTVGSNKQFYINGLPITTIVPSDQEGILNFSATSFVQQYPRVTVGNAPIIFNTQARSFEGKIGEIIIFDDKLTSEQVLSNYNKTKNRYIFDGNDAILSTADTELPEHNTEGDTSFFTLGNNRYFEFEEPIANVFSVSFWVRIRNPGLTNKLPIFSNSVTHQSFFWGDDGTTNGTGWFFQDASQGVTGNPVGDVTPYNTWQHIVLQKGPGIDLDLFQDGIETGAVTAFTTDDITTIGRDFSTSAYRYGDFDISKFQVYSVRLDPVEITAIYNKGR